MAVQSNPPSSGNKNRVCFAGHFSTAWVKHYCTYERESKRITMVPFDQKSGGKAVSVGTKLDVSWGGLWCGCVLPRSPLAVPPGRAVMLRAEAVVAVLGAQWPCYAHPLEHTVPGP